MDELKQVTEQVNKLLTEMKSVRTTENMKDPMVEQKFDRIADQMAQLAEKSAAADAEKKAMADRLEGLEAAIARKGSGDVTEDKKAEHKKAFAEYLRHGVVPEGVKASKEGGIEIRALSTDSNPDGGYSVMTEMASFVVGRNFETSPIRQVARVVSGSAKSLSVIIDDDEAEAEWTNERSAADDTDTPEIGLLEIFAHKIDAEPKATPEMLEDSFLDVEAWLQGKVADKIGRKENTAFVAGNGVGQPKGLLSHAAWASAGVYERNKIEQIVSGATATLTADGLISLQNSLKEVYQANATFMMKRATFGQILKLKGADNYFFSPTLLRDGQNTLQLLGKNVRFADDMQAVGAGNLAVAYGDFREGYTVYDRIGLQVIRDNVTSKGFIKYYVAKRTGGHVTNFDAIKLQKVAVS